MFSVSKRYSSTLRGLIAEAAKTRPHSDAVFDARTDTRFTYSELETNVAAYAKGLKGAFAPGDKLGIVTGSRAETLVLLAASEEAGVTPVVLGEPRPRSLSALMFNVSGLVVDKSVGNHDLLATVGYLLPELSDVWPGQRLKSLEYPRLKFIFCTGRGNMPLNINLLRDLPDYSVEEGPKGSRSNPALPAVVSWLDSGARAYSHSEMLAGGRQIAKDLALTKDDSVAILVQPGGETTSLFYASLVAALSANALSVFPGKVPNVDYEKAVKVVSSTGVNVLIGGEKEIEQLSSQPSFSKDNSSVSRAFVGLTSAAANDGLKALLKEKGVSTLSLGKFN